MTGAAYIYAAVRTPFGRLGGALAGVLPRRPRRGGPARPAGSAPPPSTRRPSTTSSSATPTAPIVTVRRLEAPAGGKVVEGLAGAGLEAMMQPYGQRAHSVELKPGQGAYVLIDVSLAAKAKVPPALTHRIALSMRPKQAAVATGYELAPVKVTRREAVVVAPPLRGPGWVVANGCCAAFTGHRGTVLPVNGAPYVAGRFAIDFVQIDALDRLFEGPLDQLSSYPYFGDEVHSATAGKVVGVLDNIPNTPAGAFPPAITAEKADGNHVVVAFGGGHYAFYAHLQPGTVRVKVGQKVKVGQVLGLLGNSGNSNAPHLHFHVMDSPRPLASNGMPYRFRSFTVEGTLTNLEGIEAGRSRAGRARRTRPAPRRAAAERPGHRLPRRLSRACRPA